MTPCWEEPFGLVAIEALACGTPVAGLRPRRAAGDPRRRAPAPSRVPDDAADLARQIERGARLSAAGLPRARRAALLARRDDRPLPGRLPLAGRRPTGVSAAPRIGIYVHHHGGGHAARAGAIGRALGERGAAVTYLSSLPPERLGPGSASSCRSTPTSGRTAARRPAELHFAPLGSRRPGGADGAIAGWIERLPARPAAGRRLGRGRDAGPPLRRPVRLPAPDRRAATIRRTGSPTAGRPGLLAPYPEWLEPESTRRRSASGQRLRRRRHPLRRRRRARGRAVRGRGGRSSSASAATLTARDRRRRPGLGGSRPAPGRPRPARPLRRRRRPGRRQYRRRGGLRPLRPGLRPAATPVRASRSLAARTWSGTVRAVVL